MNTAEKEVLTVSYLHGQKGLCRSNIIWAERDRGSAYYPISKFAMDGGKFPANHPCAPGSAGNGIQLGDSESLRKFRERGYMASCFPEGDGISLDSGDRTAEEVIKDIEECFGWKVKK